MIDALGRVPVKVWVEDFEFGEDFQALTTVANVIAALPADATPEVIAWLREQGAVDVEAELRFARDAILGWAGYASDYFKDKWDLAGDLARIDAALVALSPTGENP